MPQVKDPTLAWLDFDIIKDRLNLMIARHRIDSFRIVWGFENKNLVFYSLIRK